jgi:phytoene dehydrogenase-like protein
VRSAELTLPGFVHDLCSAIHPLAIGSPFFRTLPLHQYELEWIHPEFPLAHPLDDGTAVVLRRSIEETAKGLSADATAYAELMRPLTAHWESLVDELLRPILRLPRHPLQLARFARGALCSAKGVAQSWFRDERSKALFAGLAAHSFLPLDQIPSSAFAIVLGIFGHARRLAHATWRSAKIVPGTCFPFFKLLAAKSGRTQLSMIWLRCRRRD